MNGKWLLVYKKCTQFGVSTVRKTPKATVKSVKNWKLTSEFCYLRTEVNNKSNWIHKNNNQPYEIMSKQDRR